MANSSDMKKVMELETTRLKLRQWKDDDYPTFAEMNADPCVMEYFPATMTKAESDEMADEIRSLIAKRGWGFWAVEEKTESTIYGFYWAS